MRGVPKCHAQIFQAWGKINQANFKCDESYNITSKGNNKKC